MREGGASVMSGERKKRKEVKREIEHNIGRRIEILRVEALTRELLKQPKGEREQQKPGVSLQRRGNSTREHPFKRCKSSQHHGKRESDSQKGEKTAKLEKMRKEKIFGRGKEEGSSSWSE